MKTIISLLSVAAGVAWLASPALAQNKTENNPFAVDEQSLLKIEQQWDEALRTRDTATLEKILADEYALVDPQGAIQTKAQELATLKSGDLKFESFTAQDVKARVYVGGAVVTGRVVVKGTYKNDDINGEYRFIDVFEPKKGGWQAVASQLTRVNEPSKQAK